MTQTISSQIEKFNEFIELNPRLLNKINHKKENEFLNIDFIEITKFDLDMANLLIENPKDTLQIFNLAVDKIRENNGHDKLNVKIHLKNLDQIPSCNIRIRDIRVEHYNKLWVVKGVIRQVSEIRGLVVSRKFECPLCGNIINVQQDRFQPRQEPARCPCGRKGKFYEIATEEINYYNMTIEEELDSIEGNQQPNKINIMMFNDLTSQYIEKFNTLGSRVSITGILLARPKIEHGKIMNELEKYMEANYIRQLDEKYKEIEITEQDITRIKEFSEKKNILQIMVNSFAIHIAGYDEVKKALILQLFGGVNSTDNLSKKQNRGDSHILLIGDPSTGKTQLAKAMEHKALKYRYCSGARSTKAGLTATVSKDEFTNQWGVEAGALVLAAKGICVLDEFDKMGDDDRSALHEQMESQSITIDKAVIHTKLRADTSILACANWKKSRFDPHEDMYSQINFPESLISRFDLYFPFVDNPDKKKDHIIINTILKSRYGKLDKTEENEENIDNDFFKKYLIYAKNFNPKMSEGLFSKISDYYVNTRLAIPRQLERIVMTITARQGEAIARLAEASARLHLRDVTEEDFIIAKELVEFSLKSIAFDVEAGTVDMDIIETGVSSKERDLTHKVRERIIELEKNYKEIPIMEIINSFPKDVEIKIDEIISKMKSQWREIFEPRSGFIRRL